MQIYRFHDKTGKGGMIETNESEAKYWNDQGYGIFWAVNQFNGARRKENLVKIRALICDIDDGTNEQQLEKIKSSPLLISRIVKTKRGYHLYFTVKDFPFEKHEALQLAIIKFFGGDLGAKDVCRVLRMPNYYHHKEEPFLVKLIEKNEISYSCQELEKAFPIKIEKKKVIYKITCPKNHKEILQCLSGTSYVNGETFEFRERIGKTIILINGKVSPCWIDQNGIIGTNTGHGGSIENFLSYYGWSKESAKRLIRGL
jgi:hypothetical protein